MLRSIETKHERLDAYRFAAKRMKLFVIISDKTVTKTQKYQKCFITVANLSRNTRCFLTNDRPDRPSCNIREVGSAEAFRAENETPIRKYQARFISEQNRNKYPEILTAKPQQICDAIQKKRCNP